MVGSGAMMASKSLAQQQHTHAQLAWGGEGEMEKKISLAGLDLFGECVKMYHIRNLAY